SVDVLLDCYSAIQSEMDIRHRRFEICHANFQSARNLARCSELGIVADLQPAWLYKDGASLVKTLGAKRMKWFAPLKTWLDHSLVDRDITKCPVNDVRTTQVLLTMVGGKVVWER